MARAYLDHASTTPATARGDRCADAVGDAPAAATRAGCTRKGAPSATRSRGHASRSPGCSGVAPRQVVFTSGATESINAAVWGATRAAPGAPVLCAAVEHSAVRDASARAGAGRGPRAWTAPAGSTWTRCAGACASPSAPRPALVHCQWGNHEVGTLQPVREVVGAVPRGRRHRARGRRGGLWPRADRSGRARRRPGQRERAQAGWRARSGRPGRPAWEPVRAAPGRRRTGAGAAGRAGADPRAARLRGRGGGAGRRRSAADRDGGRGGPAADRDGRRRGAGGRRGRGGRRRRAGATAPCWCASASRASRPSRC